MPVTTAGLATVEEDAALLDVVRPRLPDLRPQLSLDTDELPLVIRSFRTQQRTSTHDEQKADGNEQKCRDMCGMNWSKAGHA